MYCPRMGLAYCVLLHSSLWVVVCGRSVCVTRLVPVGTKERKMCGNSLGDNSGVLGILLIIVGELLECFVNLMFIGMCIIVIAEE